LKTVKADILILWKRISGGDDEKAFESLFYLLNPSLIKFCMMYIHQREAAEEIVSEVFTRCWLNRKTLIAIQHPDTYLFVAVKNHSYNYLKKFSNIHLVQLEDMNEAKFVNTFNPQKELEQKELTLKLDKAIADLPQQCRIVFRLIKEEGMKYKEVAEILEISPRTVQTQLFRAIKKLSLVLSAYQQDRRGVSKVNIFNYLIILLAILKIYF
jgi:RNA polymerase sigma-70 factor (family 1)